MKLIVGLGNPGRKYEKTRHNIGFRVIDALTFEMGTQLAYDKKFEAEIGCFSAGRKKIYLAKPQTMMNNSGKVVAKIAKYYNFQPQDIWIIHDDLDLNFGRIRVRFDGSSAGHNGIKSIVGELDSGEFYRFKIGIGPKDKQADSFVLENFSVAEEEKLPKIIDKCKQILLTSLKNNKVEERSFDAA